MFHNAPKPETFIGSVGWEEDDDTTYYDLGTADNDGYTLVRVQLFEGRDPTKPLNPTRAQGTRLVCHISAGARIPPRNTRCYVQIPRGMEMMPGAGIITHTVEKTLDGRLGPDRTVMDFGDQHVVIKGKSVSIQGNDGSFVAVGTPRSGGTNGVTVQAPDGSGAVFQAAVAAIFAAGSAGSPPGMVQVTPSKVDIVAPQGPAGADKCTIGGGFYVSTPGIACLGAGSVILGVLAPPLTTYKPMLAGAGPTNPNILMASTP